MPRMIDIKPKVGLMVDVKPKMGDLIDIKPKVGNFYAVRGRVYERTLVAGQLMFLVPAITAPAQVTYVVGHDSGA